MEHRLELPMWHLCLTSYQKFTFLYIEVSNFRYILSNVFCGPPTLASPCGDVMMLTLNESFDVSYQLVFFAPISRRNWLSFDVQN